MQSFHRKSLIASAVIVILLLILSAPDVVFGILAEAPTLLQTSYWYWDWRQPPHIIIITSSGYPQVLPASTIVVWGGPTHSILFSETVDLANESHLPKGLYRSFDEGFSWEHIAFDFDDNEIRTLHPVTSSIVLAGTENRYPPGGMYRSSDAGDTWVNVLAGRIIYDIEVDPTDPGTIYASTCCWGGIFKSIDYGQTWDQISDQALYDLEVNPAQRNVIFGARFFSTNPEEGIYRSDDSGETWIEIGDIDGKAHPNIIIDSQQPDRMYAFGGGYYGIWRTEDGGQNWDDLSPGLPYVIGPPTVQSAVFDSQNDLLWIGLKYGGILLSTDFGNTWTEFNNGLPFVGAGIFGPQCTSITISPADKVAINCNGRIYVRSVLEVTFFPLLER